MSDKKCVICGCKDHKIIGCSRHWSKNCSCHAHWKSYWIIYRV